MFKYLILGVYVVFIIWYIYRSGYEDGRKYELDREARRLDEESRRIAERLRRTDGTN